MTRGRSHNRRGTLSATVLAAVVLTVVAWQAGRASADAPARTGWWNAANTGAVDPPVPPDVPDGSLYVAGGPPNSSPSAFSAVLITPPDGQTAKTLTLTPDNTPSPNLAVQACLIPSGDFPGGDNQPSSAEPTYDCAKVQPAPGQVDPASGAVTFAIGPLAEAAAATTPGKLAIAIVPVGATDRVAFAAPDPNSVTLGPAADSGSGTGTATSPDQSTAGSTASSSSSSTSSSSSSSSGSPTLGSATTGGFDSSSALASGASSAPAPATPAAAAAAPAPPTANSAAAAAPAGSASRSTRLPAQAFASSHPSGTATKVGGALALALLIAALIAYIRGFGLMGGRIAD